MFFFTKSFVIAAYGLSFGGLSGAGAVNILVEYHRLVTYLVVYMFVKNLVSSKLRKLESSESPLSPQNRSTMIGAQVLIENILRSTVHLG